MNKTFTRAWIATSAIAALIAGPFLAQGDQASQERAAKHLQQISEMSVAERDRLDRNFDYYQRLSESEKLATEALHQELERDRNQGNGELSKIMEDYTDWLSSIEAYQRDRLMEKTDPKQRIDLMREIVAEQEIRKAGRFSGSPRGLPGRFESYDPPPAIEIETLRRLIDGLMETNPALYAGRSRQINEASGLPRLYEILSVIHPFRENPEDVRTGRRYFELYDDVRSPLQNLAGSFDKYVEDSKARDYINEPENDQVKLFRLARMIRENFGRYVFAEIFKDQEPKLPDLVEHFAELPEQEQDTLLQLAATDFYDQLILDTSEQRLQPGELRFEHLKHLFYRTPDWRRRGRGDGPGFGPPGRGGGRGFGDRERPGEDEDRRRGGFGGRPGEGPPRFDNRSEDGSPRFGQPPSDGRRAFDGPRDNEDRGRPERPIPESDDDND